MTQRIRGILFDLGDTLLDFGQVDPRSLFEAGGRLAYEYLQRLGQPLPSFASFHRKQLWQIRWNYLRSRFTRREFNALELIGRISDRMGHDLTHDQVVELAWLWYEPLSRRAKVEADLPRLLGEFRDTGLKLGVVSNTFIPGEVLDRHLAAEGLLEYLPIRVYSCDVRYRKPHPSIFTVALDRCGLKARETLFVGDSLKADICGANRAGLVSVWKSPVTVDSQSGIRARHHIQRLAELGAILSQYNVEKT